MSERWKSNRSNGVSTLPLLAIVLIALLCPPPCLADINADLEDAGIVDTYLQREFDWVMRVDIHDTDYANYRKSQLRPLTEVAVSFRSFQRGVSLSDKPSELYEEFWYHQGTPVGMRRFRTLNIAPNHFGTIVVGTVGDHCAAAANVVIRLLLDLALKNVATSVVLVPQDKYDQIAAELARNNFFPTVQGNENPQINIHLRAYPSGKDRYYFFHQGT